MSDRDKKIKILFITEASRTGAPILLMDVLRVLKTLPGLDITILIKREDVLVSEFRSIAKTYVLKGRLYNHKSPNTLTKTIRVLFSLIKRVELYPKLRGTEIIVSNTITNGGLIGELHFLNAATICYVHELQGLINTWSPQSDIKKSLAISDLFIVPSSFIKESLQKFQSVPGEKVKIFDTYLPPHEEEDNAVTWQRKDHWRKKFNIHGETFFVAGMGTADHRKGIDLFLKTAAFVSARDQGIKFIWIGPFANKKLEEEIMAGVKSQGLEKTVFFAGSLPRSGNNLKGFDLFYLSSREDPYPLVVLEAAALGIPSLCFENAGGTIDFIADGCGWAVENSSHEKAAEKILELNKNRTDLETAGKNALKKVNLQHQNKQHLINQFTGFIQEIYPNAKSTVRK
jgi:glycosyltransferase involved in cell wall biosynthesis